MSATLSIAEAKAHFAAAVRRVERGESLVLTRHGRPVARLEPLAPGAAAGGGAREEIREIERRYDPGDPALVAEGRAERRREALAGWLAENIWPRVPAGELGERLSRREREEILGYGSEGV